MLMFFLHKTMGIKKQLYVEVTVGGHLSDRVWQWCLAENKLTGLQYNVDIHLFSLV